MNQFRRKKMKKEGWGKKYIVRNENLGKKMKREKKVMVF